MGEELHQIQRTVLQLMLITSIR